MAGVEFGSTESTSETRKPRRPPVNCHKQRGPNQTTAVRAAFVKSSYGCFLSILSKELRSEPRGTVGVNSFPVTMRILRRKIEVSPSEGRAAVLYDTALGRG